MVRRLTELGGLRDIRTMHSVKKRSIPRVQSSTYLDLYMLYKEKDRLEKEVYILEKRKKGIQKRLDEIIIEMGKLEKAKPIRGKVNRERFEKPSGKEWRTIPLKY